MELIGLAVLAAMAAAAGSVSVGRKMARRNVARLSEQAHQRLLKECGDAGWTVGEPSDLLLVQRAETVLGLVGKPGDGDDAAKLVSLAAPESELGSWQWGTILYRDTPHGGEIAFVGWREIELRPTCIIGMRTDGVFRHYTVDNLAKTGVVELGESPSETLVDTVRESFKQFELPWRLRLAQGYVLARVPGMLTPEQVAKLHDAAHRVHEKLPRTASRL